MGEVVNLRQAAKRLARARKAVAADENRLRFGRSGSAKRLEQSEKRKAAEALDAHRLEASTLNAKTGSETSRADDERPATS